MHRRNKNVSNKYLWINEKLVAKKPLQTFLAEIFIIPNTI